ncbi:MAG: hypothetical protein GX540_02985 [Clostridiales bacterium]|nr:hypothetical protein [Clostridiales bacterium]
MAWIQENLLSLLVGIGLIFLLAMAVAATSQGRKSLCGCGQRSEGSACGCGEKHLQQLKEE